MSAVVVQFSDLRLKTPMAGQPIVLLEYGEPKQVHQVALTCTAQGKHGRVYIGGYCRGRFSVFRTDKVARLVCL